MEKFKHNDNNVLTIITVISLFISIIGVSIASYYWTFTGNKNTITTGNVSISILESVDSINIVNALPISDAEGINLLHDSANSGVFDFAISTYASGAPGNIAYTISVTKAQVDSGYDSL